MNIPFVDLQAQYLSIKDSIDNAIANVIRDSAFIGGTYVKNFEQAYASHLGVKHCISCANGTDSIEILLESHGIGPGDEVIVPAISWISTSEAVTAVGAIPVFVDIDPDFYTINATQISSKITRRTKAIIPVHLYGHPADMGAIIEIAKQNNLVVIEDCAQAHDAAIGSVNVGRWGHSASYSFYPGKNLGAYGDAGCMTTQDDSIALSAKMIANHGQLKKHDHVREGRNSRLDGLQAAILSAKLPYLTSWTAHRISRAAYYTQLLKGTSIQTPATRANTTHVFHLYVVRVENRQQVMEYMKQRGIDTAVHYPKALPFLSAYRRFQHTTVDFPVAAAYQDTILSLPLYPELSVEKIDYIVEHLLKVTGNS